ncbi:MAG: pyruvate synthase subunit beta [Dehalococcoidia bacterium]|nr:pyruvate synthase subunit beta [Dehalococcoidia bacterium]
MEGESIKFGKNLVTKEEFLSPGHRACQGCGLAINIRLALKVLGKDTICVTPASCWSGVGSSYPDSAWEVPWMQSLFENAAPVAGGIATAHKILQAKGKMAPRKVNVCVFAGDGGTADIGLGAVSGAMERGENIVYICSDNEAYMNTGIQRSSSTPYGAATTTTPVGTVRSGQQTEKKNVPFIIADHNIPYVATACASYPFDFMMKIKKAAEVDGPAYIHVFSVCPTGWRVPTDFTVDLGKLAVETNVFPLYEVENGVYKMNMTPAKPKPVSDYLKPQGRFRHLKPEEIEHIQATIDWNWKALQARVEATKDLAR